MEKILNQILEGQNKLFQEVIRLSEGQKQLSEGQKQLSEGQKTLFARVDELAEGQKQLFEGQKEIKEDIKCLKTEAEANKQFRTIVMDTLGGIEDEIVETRQEFTEIKNDVKKIDAKQNFIAKQTIENIADIELLKKAQ